MTFLHHRRERDPLVVRITRVDGWPGVVNSWTWVQMVKKPAVERAHLLRLKRRRLM